MGVTVGSYKARTEGVLNHLGAAEDMLVLLLDELDKEETLTDEEDEFYYNLCKKVERALKNVSVTMENVEFALDLPLVTVE